MLRRFLLPCSFCVQRKISYFGLNILGIGIMIRILVQKQHMFLLPNELAAAAALLCRDLGTLVEFSGAGTALPAVQSKASLFWVVLFRNWDYELAVPRFEHWLKPVASGAGTLILGEFRFGSAPR